MSRALERSELSQFSIIRFGTSTKAHVVVNTDSSSTAPIQSGSVIGYSRSLPYRNVPNQSHASFGLSFRLERLSTRSRSCGTREHRVVRSFFF